MMRGPYNRGAVRLASMEAAKEARARRDLSFFLGGSAAGFLVIALINWLM